MSKTAFPFEDSDNYRRLLAMADPKQSTWDFSVNDTKAISWAVDALKLFASKSKEFGHDREQLLSALRIILTWAEFEHGPDYPRGHALVPEHVSRLIRKTLKDIGEEVQS